MGIQFNVNCNTQKPYFLKIKKFSFFKNIFILKSRFNFKMYGFLLLLFISKSFSLVAPFHVDNQIAVIFVKAVSLHFIQEVRIMTFLQNLYLLFSSETRANVPFRRFLSSYFGWVLQHAFHFFQQHPPGLSTDLRSYNNVSAILLENLIEPFDFS